MNQIIAKYHSKVFNQHAVKKFNVVIDNCTVQLESVSEEFYIRLTGRRNVEKIKKVLGDLESVFFFYFGSFPILDSLQINGEFVNIDERVGKYITSSIYLTPNQVICDITEYTVSQQVIDKLRMISRIPLYSLQNLVSQNYEGVIVDHKMTLLLHIIEGIYDKKNIKQDKQEIRNRYSVGKSTTIGDYMTALYWLCKNYFFNYHRRFGCGILPLLKATQYGFLQRLTDTRNWYSHFWNESKKPIRIKKGSDFSIHFDIIYYVIRLAVIDKMGTKPNEAYIKEFYYILHDWILAVVYEKDSPLKSRTYKNVYALQELKAFITQLQAQAEKEDAVFAEE